MMNSFENPPSFAGESFVLQNLRSSEESIPSEDIASRFHEAVASGDLTSVQNICTRNPECINKTSGNQEDSALHTAARNGHLAVFSFLLSQEQLTITTNRRGQNALDVAIATKETSIAQHVSSHSRWQEFLHEKQEGSELTQLQHMVIKMPDVAERFLDRCIEQVGDPDSKDEFSVKYNFSLLYDTPSSVEIDSIRKPSDTLKTMVEEESIGCLTHPLCLAYMKNKWHGIGFWFFYLNLVVYLVFLVCLTLLTMLLQRRSHDTVPYIRALRYVVLASCLLHFIKELMQLIHLRLQYFTEVENWLEVSLYTISLSCMIIYGDHEDKRRTTQQLRGTMALSIFLAWAVFILYVRRSMMFGNYIIMMVTIVSTMVKIIVLMLPFVCAYGIPFYILFSIPEFPPCEKQNNIDSGSCSNTTATSKYLFDSLSLSVWTTFMLLLGEMKYPHTLYKYQPLPYPYVTYLVYLTFVLCMPIIIKNLMIGLSVGDVKRIKESAKQKHFISQVNMVIDVDKNLPSFILRWLYVSHVTEHPLHQESMTRKIMDFGFLNILPQSSSQRENRNRKMERKNDLDELGKTIATLSATMNNQEKKINEIFDILRDIRSTMVSWKDCTPKF